MAECIHSIIAGLSPNDLLNSDTDNGANAGQASDRGGASSLEPMRSFCKIFSDGTEERCPYTPKE
ncbi:hypothetical protein M413DRAFT_23510 [Hebeloma cylindrosporum]|uniref:Uncharacterized protein n=1 Tax=Hebeloma cylindrosporum TaxID=76867 RepID=A0A0C3CET6_HEBCY|nr:hypothetical protein M413DRAFT_23510 [Hebeloma cylindrosporum h7]